MEDLQACEQALQISEIERQLEAMQTDIVRTRLTLVLEQAENMVLRYEQRTRTLEDVLAATNNILERISQRDQQLSVMQEQLQAQERLIAHLANTIEHMSRVPHDEASAANHRCADRPAAGADPPKGANNATDECDFFECKICHARPMTHACVPCGHFLMCSECSEKVQECPVCRQHVERVQVIYFS